MKMAATVVPLKTIEILDSDTDTACCLWEQTGLKLFEHWTICLYKNMTNLELCLTSLMERFCESS